MNVWIIREAEVMTSSNSKKFRYISLSLSLIESSHKVIFFTSSFDHFSKKQKALSELKHYNQNIEFVLLKSISYLKHISLLRLINQFQLAMSFKSNSKLLAKPDIIICSVPSIQLAHNAVKFANKYNIPIILDIVDLWPDLFRHFLPTALRIIAFPYMFFLRNQLKRSIRNTTAITALTDSYLSWGLSYREPSIELVKTIPLANESVIKKNSNNDFTVLFVGSITRQFNFTPLFDAASKLQSINFSIVGDGDLLKKLKNNYPNLPNLKWTGWLEAEQLEKELLNSSIAIMPYKDLPHFQKNITNKFSEYLAYGLPILSSVSGEMRELIERYECGHFFSNSEKLYELILEYRDNPVKLKQHRENSKRLQRERFDQKTVNKDFVDFIQLVHSRYHH